MSRWFAAVTLPMPTAARIDRPAEVERLTLPAGPTESLDASEIVVSGPRNNAPLPVAISPEVLDRADAPVAEETLWYELVGRLFEYKQHRRHWRGERGPVHADVIDIP